MEDKLRADQESKRNGGGSYNGVGWKVRLGEREGSEKQKERVRNENCVRRSSTVSHPTPVNELRGLHNGRVGKWVTRLGLGMQPI